MKKIFLSAALVACCASGSFAAWVTIEVKGVKSGPTTSNGGSVSFDCDYTISTCGTVVVNCLQVPQQGDPTIVTTYSNGQPDAQYTGGYISISQNQNQNGTTNTVNLSDLKQDF